MLIKKMWICIWEGKEYCEKIIAHSYCRVSRTLSPPKFVAKPLINYFRLFPSLPIHLSFACWHLSCLIFFDVAHYHQK
ncbi:MAG: hypothetical protein HXN64_04020 [Prevotella pallens]|nr:hypothetical protein [Prevotella pallens]